MSAPRLLPAELRAKLDQLELITRRRLTGRIRGERRSQKKGRSLEFADYRTYVPGDDIRFVDWKVFARLDRLFLKLFLDEEDLSVYLLVDASGSMATGSPEKLRYAKQVAAALAYVCLGAGHRVSLLSFAERLEPLCVSARGKGAIGEVLAALERVRPGGKTRSLAPLAELRRRALGAGYVVVLSDLLDKDGFEAALKQAVRMEVVLFHLLSPEEEEVAWDGDWRLLDAEDGEAVRVSMSPSLREQYAETVRRFRGEHKALCRRLGFEYVPVRTDFPVEALLLLRLRDAGILG